MSRFFNRKSIISILIALILVTTFVGGVLLRNTSQTQAASPKATAGKNPFCSRIGQSVQASSGAQMYCFGVQSNTVGHPATTSSFGTNVNAANPKEDITPAGMRAYGQSEVSIAGIGPYVVESWNDATGFFSPCPSPMYKEELTGLGFSANGGKSFKDLGGLPNDCTTGFRYFGDPSVETWKPGGTAYFYLIGLYINNATGQSDLAMDACKATGTGTSASLSCSTPIIVATGGTGDFLDKEFLSIDPKHGRLYTSYTRFGPPSNPGTTNGQIELAVCDIGTPSGGTGPAGGTAGTPVCFPGASPAPYFVVAPGDTNCENEGAYPAVDVKTGDVYVAWEFNWATNYYTAACYSVPTQNKVAYVPFTCLTLTPTSPCVTTPTTVAVNIVSMAAAHIAGYNRFPANDFPRIAVSNPYGTVTIVWNDARVHPLGDIYLQSYNLVSLSPVKSQPVRINPDASGGMHFLPALRKADDGGNLSISYYQRDVANTDSTNVDALLDLNPRTASYGSRVRVTTGPTAWLDTSSNIIPNFGDYTDNYMRSTQNAPYTDDVLYVAWADGRLGVPQPFEAHGMS